MGGLTTEIFFSSRTLGDITNHQLQLMLDRFALGSLISSEMTPNGVGKQTLFIQSTTGKYVLKGNPLYTGQFMEEKYFVDQLSKRTQLPVPVPYIVDESTDIFGWSYAIMPHLTGCHINDLEGLQDEEKQQIGILLARTLHELHQWKTERYGEYDAAARDIRPFAEGYQAWLYGRIKYWLEDAKKYSDVSSMDIQWVDDMLFNSLKAFTNCSNVPSFIMGDFNPNNILVQMDTGAPRISGIFDFTMGYFGDGLADLPPMLSSFLDDGEMELAKSMLNEYYRLTAEKELFVERLKIHMLHQRILDWGCAYATRQVTWDPVLPFYQWAEQYTDSVQDLLEQHL